MVPILVVFELAGDGMHALAEAAGYVDIGGDREDEGSRRSRVGGASAGGASSALCGGDPRGLLLGISVNPGGDVREDNAVDVVLHSDVQGISIAGGEELRIVLVSVVNRTHSMNHIFCRKIIAAGNLGFSGMASVQFPALL